MRIGYTLRFVDRFRAVCEISGGSGFIAAMALMMLSIVVVDEPHAICKKDLSASLLEDIACSIEMAYSTAVDIVEHRRHTEECLHTVFGRRLVFEMNKGEQLIPMQSKLGFGLGGLGGIRHAFRFLSPVGDGGGCKADVGFGYFAVAVSVAG